MSSPEVAQIVSKAQDLITACEYDLAHKFLLRAKETLEKPGGASAEEQRKELIAVLELLGEAELELGLPDEAKERFQQSISLSSSLPLSEQSSSSHLNLAQLSDKAQEAMEHYRHALSILKSTFKPYPTPAPEEMQDLEEQELTEEEEAELEARQMAAKCLVGMTELYLTDLCFEPEAEEKCEQFLLEAVSIYDADPEVYQTLASVRLSQQRPDEAQQAIVKSWSLWRDDDPTENPPPPFPTRIAMTRMLIELELYQSALEILDGLEAEDDEDAEVAYLKGWCWFLRGETWDEKEHDQELSDASKEEDEESEKKDGEEEREPENKEECYEAALEALKAAKKGLSCYRLLPLCAMKLMINKCLIQLNDKNPLEPDIFEHVVELTQTLERMGIKPPKDAEPEEQQNQDVEMS
ncbi:hypothetical protein BT69DRAFT_1321334 [Atractiella rhizophila]|nr:hypothetical protein BT69DRAFT_1321334 [Atractiella rhizophila]